MSTLPTRRPPPASSRITHSLNRLSQPAQPSPISHILLIRPSRRIRWLTLLTLLTLLLLLLLYRPRLTPHYSDGLLARKKSEPIPTVSRDVLDVLEELDQDQRDDEQKAIQEMTSNSNNNPDPDPDPGLPRVTALPTDHRHSTKKQSCPDQLAAPCRFLIAGYIGEQETKAQIHLHQLGLLARALNRTLVLPQLSQSRMGSCLEHPFDLYYRPDALSRLGISTLSHAAFTRWAAAAPTDQPPSARLLAIIDHNQLPSAPPQGSVSYDHTTPARDTLAFLAQERQFCLRNNAPINPKHPSKQLTLNFQPFPPLTIVSPLRWQKSAAGRDKFAKLIIDSARQSDAISPPPAQANRDMSPDKRSLFTGGSEPPQEAIIPDALVVNYELRYPFLDPSSTTSQLLLQYGSTTQPPAADLKPFEHFPYAPAWVQLAESLLAQAPALVGLHWRQENIPVPDLQRCASSLLLTLDSLKTAYPSLEAVYLSTDYPIEQAAPDDQHPSGGRASSSDREVQAHSGTFSKSITQDHHRMMRALLAQPVALRWLTFNGLLDSLDLDHDLLDKLLQLSVFSTAKETARLMKVARKADSAQEWSDGQRPEEEDKAHRREVSRLVKDTLRLRAGPSGGAGEPGKPVDIGVVAIVEKLLLVRASVFLTGVPGQCSKRSSFTNQVVLHRQRLIDRSFLDTGVLTDYDYPGNPSPSLQRFNLVEFWGPSE